MNLIIRNKITLLLIIMFYAIYMCISLAAYYNEYPNIVHSRSDLGFGIISLLSTCSILFSLFTPNLKTFYQVIVSFVFFIIVLALIRNRVSDTVITGMILGQTINISYYIFKIYRLKRQKK